MDHTFEQYNYDLFNDIGQLPSDIRAMIKRKSSRDPLSRFANKLHVLLNYAGDDLVKQQFIGVGWKTDEIFKINKKRLVNVMEIKLNTLNVNLKDLGFVQLASDHNGWTEWKRQSFNRQSNVLELSEISSDKSINKENDKNKGNFIEDIQLNKISTLKDINIGGVSIEISNIFRKITISIWEEIIENYENKSVITLNEFFHVAAERFRASHQPLRNSNMVLNAVFLYNDPNQLTIIDFAKFLAKFSPEETLMEKIGSLTSSSNQFGNWLRLINDPIELKDENSNFYGYFDNIDPNCMILSINKK